LAAELEIDYTLHFDIWGMAGEAIAPAAAAIAYAVSTRLSDAINSGLYAAALTAAWGTEAATMDMGSVDTEASTAATTAAVVKIDSDSEEPTPPPPSQTPTASPSQTPAPPTAASTVDTSAPQETASKSGGKTSAFGTTLVMIVVACGGAIILFCVLAVGCAKRGGNFHKIFDAKADRYRASTPSKTPRELQKIVCEPTTPSPHWNSRTLVSKFEYFP